MSESELGKRLTLWFDNLSEAHRAEIDFDYRNQYEGGFFRGSPKEALEWLRDNWEHHYDDYESFDPGELEVIERFRERAQEMATGELQFDSDAKVSIGDDPGAWVQAWVWVPSHWKVEVSIYKVADPKPPGGDKGWRIYPFAGKGPLTNPKTLDYDVMRYKLKHGRAFKLGHRNLGSGNQSWYLLRDTPAQRPGQWSEKNYAGLVVWEDTDAKGEWPYSTEADVLETARNYLWAYSNWTNGQVYGYEIKAGPGVEGGVNSGFYTGEALAQALNDELPVGSEVILNCPENPHVAETIEELLEAIRADGE